MCVGGDPRIDYIELYGTNQVQIHYGTEAGKTYVLQFANDVASTNWSNIHTGFNFPFSNYWHVLDYRTNKSRVYRLRVSTP